MKKILFMLFAMFVVANNVISLEEIYDEESRVRVKDFKTYGERVNVTADEADPAPLCWHRALVCGLGGGIYTLIFGYIGVIVVLANYGYLDFVLGFADSDAALLIP